MITRLCDLSYVEDYEIKKDMSDIKNIKLSFSCPMTRGSMEKTSKGYHCSSCSKQVVDFTNKSQTEFLNTLKASNSNVCGIFKSSQLNKTFVKSAAATTIVGASFVLSACGQHISKADSVEQACEIMEDIVVGEVVDDNSGASSYYNPEPIGGISKFYEALMANVNYPNSLKINGKVFISVTVDTLGRVSSVEVIKGYNDIADEEAVRAFKATNYPFKPANKDGKPIESQMIIPINFKRDE
ncbi:energy transducer TonB [Fulvivirga ligni]|uniref:energy transducer TonB n=1 Tax=Fulvivirga ligni TaxID=2904246 RepID=UPI001F3E3F55|nr:energy transducer TonB [Fulvivirga ligni]UII18987.1 energy transducer TonB [Fulvivirga ligni]